MPKDEWVEKARKFNKIKDQKHMVDARRQAQL
jgi:hypothetical protein